MFAKKEPAALRRRLEEIDRDVKLGKKEFSTVSCQAVEILVALKKLGEPLAAKEETFLKQHAAANLADFDAVAEDDGDIVKNFPSSGGGSAS